MKYLKKFESLNSDRHDRIQDDQEASNIMFDLESIFGVIDLEFDLSEKNPIASSGGIYKNEGFTLCIKINGKNNDKKSLCSKIKECILKSMSILPLEFSFCLIYYAFENPITCNKLNDLTNKVMIREYLKSNCLDEIVIFFNLKGM